MQLSPEECRLFYKIHPALMFYGNQKLRVIPDKLANPAQYAALDPEKRVQIRDAVQSHLELIEQFVGENPFKFDDDELEVVRGWRHAVGGEFYIFRYLKKYTVFLSSGSPNKAYGVLALTDLFEDMIGPWLPRMIQTVLLPFKGRIVYDGLLSGYNISFGGGFRRMLNNEYKQAKKTFGIITSLPFEGEEPPPAEPPEAFMVSHDRSGKAPETWIGGKQEIPLSLTHARRRLLAGLLPVLAHRLKIDEAASRTIRFNAQELQEIVAKCKANMRQIAKRKHHDGLRHVVDAATEALGRHKEGGIGRTSFSDRVYQFKITLKDSTPSIWRRIQIKDCSLDKLHEHIQTAMGWTNSHLHHFEISGDRYGDPELLYEGWEDEEPPINSRRTKVSTVLPANGKRFRFGYLYDFGDGWEHEILFEGCLQAKKGTRYPLCVEGERACPPEDVGGVYGYEEFLEAIADPKHEEHESFMEWAGPFNPENFDAGVATKDMQRGLPNWREME